MVTPELTQRHRPPRCQVTAALACTAALWLVTALAALMGALDPALALPAPPHPTIHPSLAAWGSIFAVNTRVLCAPLALCLLGFQHQRWGRHLGDLAVLALLLLNAGLVGIELGRWGTRLLPYLPHLPIEWLAAGTSTSSWITARGDESAPADRSALSRAAIATGGLLAVAALVEVLLTPHAGRNA